MTCIVGLKTAKGCILGADSMGAASWECLTRVDPKVFSLTPEVAIGFTTSYRMGQILRFHLEVPRIEGEEYDWTVCSLVPKIREALKEHGYAKTKDGCEEAGTFLLAVRSRLFSVEDDYQVAEAVDPFNSCGCGAQIARGALFTASILGDLSRESLEIALQAAEAYSNGVRGPFVFVETKA